jgi:hypothetical protein
MRVKLEADAAKKRAETRPAPDNVAAVQNSEMTLEMTLPGRPRSLRSSGRIGDDDSIELRGPGLGPAGKLFEHFFKGQFSTDGFTQAEPRGRPCALQLSRE